MVGTVLIEDYTGRCIEEIVVLLGCDVFISAVGFLVVT